MKKIYFLNLFLIFGTFGLLRSQANLVASYNFNAGSAADNSGNANNGTFYGSAANVDTLTIGYNTSDYFSVPPVVLNGRTQFSIMFKVKFVAFNTAGQYPTNTIYSADNASTSGIFAFSYQKDVAKWRVGNNVSAFDFADNTIITNKWYCVTLTRDNSGSMKLYIDGVQNPTVNTYATPLSITSFFIGQETDCFGGCFAANQSGNAKYDDFKFYDDVLLPSQINSTCALLISVNEHQKFDMEVYPNPVASVLKIKNTQNMNNFSLDITSVDGKEVSKTVYKNDTEIDLDVNALKPGIYFLTLTHDSEKSVMKFIKE